MAELRASGWKPVILGPVESAKANPGSLKKAIKANCWVCCSAGADPGTRFAVRDCTLEDVCPLWPHRPWQHIKGGLVYNEDGVAVAPGSDAETDDEDAE